MDSSSSMDSSTATNPLRFCKADHVQVIFRSVEETYPVGIDVHCTYRVAGSLDVGSRDWVGLYKVGWRSQSDYYYYDWATVPQDYVKGKDFEGKIIFPYHKLPKDDGEFYQFCYVTSAGQVHGASTPFQFRLTSMDDLIEIEDENGELLVIKTKTTLLEEKLKKANELKATMKQKIQTLENEQNLLVATERRLQKKLRQQKEDEESLREQLEESNEMKNEQRLQLEHLQVCLSAFQDKTEVLNQEKATMEKRLDENDAYIVSLQEKIKTLVNEKDALTGRIRLLEDEAEGLRGFVIENDRLKTRLMEEEICGARMKKEVERMEEEIQEQQVRLENHFQVSSADKETIEFLCERIRNAEDKLSAAEHCKRMLNEEVLTMKQAFEKMSSNLEEARASTDNARKSLASTQRSLGAEIERLNDEKNAVQEKLDFVTKEKEELSKQVTELQEHLDEKSNKQRSEAEGSVYALETAHATLKERYMKMAKTFEANQRTLENALCQVHELEMTLEDHKSEVERLKDRLQMAEEAYKEKYVECEMLENRLVKQQRRENSEVTSNSETERELEYVKTAFARILAKAEKYKKLYVEQKLLSDRLMKKLVDKDSDFSMTEMCVKNQTLQKPLCEAPQSSSRSQESFDALDGPGTSEMMQVPLRPLPAPMLPAKVKKVSPVASGIPSGLNDISSIVSEMSVTAVDAAAAAAENGGGERLKDDSTAEPPRKCPVCFRLLVSEMAYVAHMESHHSPRREGLPDRRE